MTSPPPLWERLLRGLLPPDQRDAALGDASEELAIRAGRDGPSAARRWYVRQVLRSLGPAVAQRVVRFPARGRRPAPRSGASHMWIRDLILARRMLARQPVFAATTLVTLAIGVGATTALFGVYRGVFLDPIALPSPDRLVFLMEQASFGCCGPASGPDYADWVARERVFSGIGILRPASVTLTGGGEAERVYATAVSASVFRFLGVQPILGRALVAADEVDPSVVVLSYGLWQRRFASRPDVLGTPLEIDEARYTIVGVMPKAFDVPSPWLGTRGHQLYTPFARAWLSTDRHSHSYPVVAQLRPGETVGTAQGDMDRIMRELAHEYP